MFYVCTYVAEKCAIDRQYIPELQNLDTYLPTYVGTYAFADVTRECGLGSLDIWLCKL